LSRAPYGQYQWFFCNLLNWHFPESL
jgi:hypothetical protein